MSVRNLLFPITALIFQITLLVIYIILAYYQYSGSDRALYPDFQHINGMVFVGLGFIFVFLKRYAFGGIAFNFLIACLVIQWAAVVYPWIDISAKKDQNLIQRTVRAGEVYMSHETMIQADYAAFAVLISFGAVMGRASRFQLLLMAIFEVVIYTINRVVLLDYLMVKDSGGGMSIHFFGACFGLAVSLAMGTSKLNTKHEAEESSYDTDIFSMIGTVFLWMYWPSFNAALALGETGIVRAHLNTYFSLAASVVTAICFSSMVNKGKLSMRHIQRATLAGGAAMGTVGDFGIDIWGAMLTGMVAGTVSVLGFRFMSGCMRKMRLHDTAGVYFVHGLPGLISGIAGAIAAAAPTQKYASDLERVFYNLKGGSLKKQGGFQFAGVVVSFGFAVVGGLIIGVIMRLLSNLDSNEWFDDKAEFEVPSRKVIVEIDRSEVKKQDHYETSKI